ncbi:Desmocollin-3 [Dirofilaria immitis]
MRLSREYFQIFVIIKQLPGLDTVILDTIYSHFRHILFRDIVMRYSQELQTKGYGRTGTKFINQDDNAKTNRRKVYNCFVKRKKNLYTDHERTLYRLKN